MTGNDGGGFHSKEWLTIDAIETLIDDAKGKPFKSNQLKELFERSSANNTGFLCAVLKAESLIVSTENSQFLHVKSDKFKSGRERYLALVKKSKSATNKKK